MAKTDTLRSRRSAAHFQATASVEREIRFYDHGGSRKYLRDFHDAYRSYEAILTSASTQAAVVNSDICLVADYHALPSSQLYFASLIRDLAAGTRPLVIGLETIFSRDQHIVEEWRRGEIDESEFRQRIRFDLDWGYDWAPFFELLTSARQHAAGLYGLDCSPREDLRKIGARDRHAALKIAEIRKRHPEALVLVLFGESHLAPRHLPAQVRALLPEERLLTLLQNVDSLYWRAAGEKVEQVEAVRVSHDVLCVFNATPLEKYENYRLYLNRCIRDSGCTPDLGPTVFNLIDGLIRFLNINSYSAENTTQPKMLVDLMPEVYSCKSDIYLRRLLSRKGFSVKQCQSFLRRVRERGSAYMAPLNAICIRRFDMATATEDAARFLNHACRGVPQRINGKAPLLLAPQDAFFVATIENALACFGSRILYPARPAFRDDDLQKLYDLTRQDLEEQSSLPYCDIIEILDFLTWHRHSKSGERLRPASPDWTRVLKFAGRKWEFVTERLGWLLGNDLYDAYIEARLGPAVLRRLFLNHIDEPGSACHLYAALNARLR
jgi:hypothetical protein